MDDKNREILKYYIMLTQNPMGPGYPAELQSCRYWYVRTYNNGLWTTDMAEATVFKSAEEAEDYMRSGMFLRNVCADESGRFSVDIILRRECTEFIKPLNGLVKGCKGGV